jgi:hypothetical protein
VKLAAPLIIGANVAKLPTLDGWSAVAVYEGAALRRDDVREWCTVGHVGGADGPVVTLEPVPTSQGQASEAGTIVSELVVAAADVATARARVFALLAPWAAWLARDRTLDGALLSTSDLHLSADVALATVARGATASAVVTITYAATTYEGQEP